MGEKKILRGEIVKLNVKKINDPKEVDEQPEVTFYEDYCRSCNSCECCNTCQDCVVGMGFWGGIDTEPPGIDDFVRAQRKEDVHIWLTLPRWLERILRTLFGWWFKPSPKEK